MTHRRIKTALTVLLLFCTIIFFTTGCGGQDNGEAEKSDVTEETQQTETTDSSADPSGDPITIEVIYGPQLGESWNSMFGQSAQKTLDTVQGGSNMKEVVLSDATAEDAIKKAVADDCDGILLIDDRESENVKELIEQTRENGIPVLGLGEYVENGYDIASPDGMGQSMTRALVAFVALQKGLSAWGDAEDFRSQLENAVQGDWSVFNSSGDWKSFALPYVMEFSKDEAGRNHLSRVSVIEDIDDTPDGKGYDYTLNTGNHYYLYPKTPGTMECHWEPDGYSASDSLNRTAETKGEGGDGNSSFYFDMGNYSDTQEYFRGNISKFKGCGATDEQEECHALNLETPVRVQTSDGKDIVIHAIQLNGDESLVTYAEKGTVVTVKGVLFEAHTYHHFTPVLLNVDSIEQR